MASKQVWVSPSGDDWKVKTAGADRAAAIFADKSDAVAHARAMAEGRGSELIVQNRDGEIGGRNSYGNDPFPPRG